MTLTFIQQAEQDWAEADSMHSIVNGLDANHFMSQRVTESAPCLLPSSTQCALLVLR
jgi:hypothetical protein